ncbi:MAG: HAD family phosphatase [Clostridia bacterium]|nr:HAD family phosphatase [Clostridia bacterium]
MIKQILFDCGGVFVDIQFRQLMEKITGDAEKAAAFYDRLFCPESPWPTLYDSGKIDTEECCRKLKLSYPELDPAHIDAYMKEWPKWLPTFPEMETIIDELHDAGYKCYLLSNFSHRFEEFRTYCPAIAHLDGEVISYTTGLVKPGVEIFNLAAKKFGIDPAETLFVDDTLPNIEGARKAGYQTYHYSTPAAFREMLLNNHILTNFS